MSSLSRQDRCPQDYGRTFSSITLATDWVSVSSTARCGQRRQLVRELRIETGPHCGLHVVQGPGVSSWPSFSDRRNQLRLVTTGTVFVPDGGPTILVGRHHFMLVESAIPWSRIRSHQAMQSGQPAAGPRRHEIPWCVMGCQSGCIPGKVRPMCPIEPLKALNCAPSGFRTPDPLIKSQLLYQLS